MGLTFNGFGKGCVITAHAAREHVYTGGLDYRYVTLRIETEIGEFGDDEDAFARYSTDEYGIEPIDLRFGGDSLDEEEAMAVALAGIELLLGARLLPVARRALHDVGALIREEV